MKNQVKQFTIEQSIKLIILTTLFLALIIAGIEIIKQGYNFVL